MSTDMWILGYILVINLIGFLIMGIDKRRAVKRAWRISEATFFLVAIVGGSIGSILGMQVFRHKTKHWYFVWGMPLILILQIVISIIVFKFSGLNITIM